MLCCCIMFCCPPELMLERLLGSEFCFLLTLLPVVDGVPIPRSARVCSSSFPVAGRLFFSWKLFTASAVFVPHLPSARPASKPSWFSFFCASINVLDFMCIGAVSLRLCFAKAGPATRAPVATNARRMLLRFMLCTPEKVHSPTRVGMAFAQQKFQ